MALRLNERYPGRFDNPSSGYPQGSFKNRSTPTAKDGSYLEKDWANDKEGFFQSLLAMAVITANGSVDAVGASQYADALMTLIRLSAYAVDSGTANTYVVTYTPGVAALADGIVLRFKAANANTGASTFNPNGLGAKAILGGAHAALQGGEIIANSDVWLQYNSSIGGGSWILVDSTGGALQTAPAVKSQQAVQFGQMTSIVGSSRNAKMLITAASATATFTADELVVESALGGLSYRLSSFNKTINLGTTGAGGMDTGTAPVSGFVGIYAIYNPTTGASALLATNATSAAAPEVYGGANMPAGYTASALVSVWQTDASRNLVIGFQVGRRISRRPFTAVGGAGPTGGAVTSVSIAGAVPLNTVRVFGSYGMNNSTTTSMAFHIYTGTVSQAGDCFIAINGTNINSNYEVCVDFPQAIAYSNTGAGGTFFIYVNGYEF